MVQARSAGQLTFGRCPGPGHHEDHLAKQRNCTNRSLPDITTIIGCNPLSPNLLHRMGLAHMAMLLCHGDVIGSRASRDERHGLQDSEVSCCHLSPLE